MSRFLGVAPYFFVSDIHRSADFYRDVLGFSVKQLWGEPPCFAMPTRDGLTVMLSQACRPDAVKPNGADGETWDAYFWVTDADSLFDEYQAKAVKVIYPPKDQEYYGNREFAIQDPDGHILAFAHDIAGKKKRQQESGS